MFQVQHYCLVAGTILASCVGPAADPDAAVDAAQDAGIDGADEASARVITFARGASANVAGVAAAPTATRLAPVSGTAYGAATGADLAAPPLAVVLDEPPPDAVAPDAPPVLTRPMVDAENLVINGLPAISGDGQLIAIGADSYGPCEVELSIRFVRVRDQREVDHLAASVPVECDIDAATAARAERALAKFAARAGKKLERGGYRTMAAVDIPPDDTGSGHYLGAGVAVTHVGETGALTITDPATGDTRWTGTVPPSRITCTMVTVGGDEDVQPSQLFGVHVDASTGTALLTYGHRYESCMCDYADAEHTVIRLER